MSGLIFGQFYSPYLIFPTPKSVFPQYLEENSQFQNFEEKSSFCQVKVDLKLFVQDVYSGFTFMKISVVCNGC